MSNEQVVNLNTKNKKINNRQLVKLSIFFTSVIAIMLIFLTNVYIVKEGEYKVVRQFGEVVRIDDQPGLKVKIPFIQSTTTLPKVKMTYDVTEEEINTKDKKRIIIDNYSVWQITDPKLMITNVRSVTGAESKMEEYIYSVVRSELGSLEYKEIVNDEKSSRGSLNEQVTLKVNELLQKNSIGITVLDVRMKRTDLPSENEQAVYTRMISERESKAQEYLSKGDASKNRIIAETDREVTELLAQAKADASVIRAEGEAEAASIYNQSFSKDPNFYSLYRTLESYKKTINDETVIMIPSTSSFAKYLQGNN
ncbi:protease modulator HflC [Mangrovibacillus cuniculi]|uniref:Protein HflC n=1 Tax=Mangrovibacillus cuniculi TaxID=2593652 RepID=A0A7S8HFX2_9BACI|nr:protease modulator HflC [Mangrovibacillus cuniculi]QPC47197.1 protease modulator HflC [Mangrovibacillus cuniculi]